MSATVQEPISKELTDLDKRIFSKFRALVRYEMEEKSALGMRLREGFASDDFTEFGLDKMLYDKQHGKGAMFLRWKENDLIKATGQSRCSRTKSDHSRRIPIYVFGRLPP